MKLNNNRLSFVVIHRSRSGAFVGSTFVSAAFALVLALFVACGSKKDNQPAKMELPQIVLTDTTSLVQYEAYTLMYNHERLNPQWVAWELTADETEGEVQRNSKFRVDTSLHFLQADNDDYRNSGWDRGHMAPAADMKWSETAMCESFYYVNACPQNHNLNGGVWKSLEEKCRALANTYGKLWITCGPLYYDGKYGSIGPHCVSVPDAFFKVLLIHTCSGYHGIGFIFDNCAGKKPLEYYVWTIDEVEDITGFNFFCSLSPEEEQCAESTVDLNLWLL